MGAKFTLYFCFFVFIGLILYLSWLPSPDIGDVLPFPTWLRQWTNKNMNLRTAVPFLFLGLIAELFLTGKKAGNAGRLWALVLLVSIVSIAEIGQLWLPKRHFDWGDIGYGIAGSLLGMVSAHVSCRIIYRFKKNNTAQ